MKDRTLDGYKFKSNYSDRDDVVMIKNKIAKGRAKKIMFVPNLIKSTTKPNLDSVDN